MSELAIQVIVNRALNDSTFREQLQTNPANAIEGYDLTDQEQKLIISRNRNIIGTISRVGNIRADDTVDVTVVVVVVP
jgi:hypothetical protein